MIHPSQNQKLFYDTLMESQYWPEEKRRDLQRTHLARLLRHARDHVPFYGERLDALFSRSGDIDWSRWNDIPIVRRADLRDHREAMLSPSLPPVHGRVHDQQSSGSTGARITVTHSDYAGWLNRAAVFRAHGWHGIDWSKDIFSWWGEDAGVDTLEGVQTGPKWGPLWMPEATGRQFTLNRHVATSDVLAFIRDHNVGYVGVKPMSAHVLALEALRLGIRPELDAILAHGTAARPDERERCREAFGARMILAYSAKEGQHMAYPCPHGHGYHVSEETVLLEIVDADGQHCADGEVGRVLVTPIFNFAQPLIRYEQGDLAAFGAPCSCGRTLKVIDRIVGRQESLFRFPDGSNVALSMSFDLMEEFGATYWQIAQTAPLAIEVRYVWRGGGTGDEAHIAETIRASTRQNVSVAFRRVEDITRAPNGKFIPYVYEVPPQP
jgi:phenylacetate-CoA ligase